MALIPAPGTVLVADELIVPGGSPIRCPAAGVLEGELRRRGVPTVRGPLGHQGDPGLDSLAVTLSGSKGPAGLGVAAAHGDLTGWPAARDALGACLAVARPRIVLLAAPRSFCAGVERAIEIVAEVLRRRGGPIYVRKQIVHNAHVVADLAARGAVFVEELAEVPDGATVVFSAHGVSPAVREEAARRGLDVIDATCPLVTKVHAEARRFAGRGDTVLLIGHEGHEEVEGTYGEAPRETIVVADAAEAARVSVPDPARVSYLTQTTLAVDEAQEVVDVLRDRFPKLRGPGTDDICYATTNRQQAVAAIARESDVVLVVGSANSSNSMRMVELARRHDTPSHLIDDAADIRPEWLARAGVVGLSAGASAPPYLVDAVVAALDGLGGVTADEREVTHETIRFTLPAALRVRGQ
ncbi:4-hydroxy-3-methylbut-2-enyl diphosphate reductase [Spongiactinospora gelatinilytica]|uniref:4-hydroxy-3-methylbut-2-enyl diphosphate reductase n=1 Tax=Spongiactinospora gelatinilytica TaxID=2666298 RepID=A0A2W2GNE3_9ACTN|nr:4-hydroxy-3-methylbut-2-enyl diphosphate reductase [Spongiactinospora gelatinilytica]PZG44199.1 4-hydroxy-3-methylbut-2-enyl diphosphate reductase [Spongiactinospora gelatinilytica]